MNKIYLSIIGLGCGLWLCGCSSDTDSIQEETDLTPLAFTAGGVETSVSSRATGDAFPNGKQVTVLAANATSTVADWSSDFYFTENFDAGTEQQGGVYNLQTNKSLYWPFEATKYLSFVAYSPTTATGLTVSNTDLAVTTPFPDLLYTAPTSVLNKTYNIGADNENKAVNLGIFNHAMSKVEIQVIPVKSDGTELKGASTNFKVGKIELQSKQTQGIFHLTGDNKSTWTLSAANTDFVTVCTPLNTEKVLSSKITCSGDYYLLPTETLANNQVVLTLMDGPLTRTFTYTLDKFIDGTLSCKLEQGKLTVLTIKIKIMDITTGDTDGVILNGTLHNWDYKGEGTITIQ